jgi:lysophospholipase L1-like esterase
VAGRKGCVVYTSAVVIDRSGLTPARRAFSVRGMRLTAPILCSLAALLAGNAMAAELSPADGSPPVRIVALGDSTTAPMKSWAPEVPEVYADLLPRALASHGIHAEVVNAGIGDTTTRDAVLRLDRDVFSHRPQVIVVQFGINDSWIDVDEGETEPRLSRAEYRNNLRAIIAAARRHRARVVLMTPNPMRWGDPYYLKVFRDHPGILDVNQPRGINRLLDEYVQDVREVAHEEHVPLVDVFAAYEAYGSKPGNSMSELLIPDGFHPSEQGQQLVCTLLARRLTALLRGRRVPLSATTGSAARPAASPE